MHMRMMWTISRNLKAREEALQKLGNTAQAIGLIINQEKQNT